MKRFLIIIMIMIPSFCFAEIHAVDSVEWQTVTAQQIVAGKVNAVKQLNIPKPKYGTQWIYEEVTVDVSQTLKGTENLGQITFIWRTIENESAKLWQQSGHEMLFFLGKDTLQGEEITLIETDTLTRGTLDAIDLETASTLYWPVVSRHGTLLKNKNDIITAVKTALLYKNPIRKKQLDLGENSEAYQKLWSGSAVYIIGPDVP